VTIYILESIERFRDFHIGKGLNKESLFTQFDILGVSDLSHLLKNTTEDVILLTNNPHFASKLTNLLGVNVGTPQSNQKQLTLNPGDKIIIPEYLEKSKIWIFKVQVFR